MTDLTQAYLIGLAIGLIIGGSIGITVYALIYAARENSAFDNGDGPPVYVSPKGYHYIKPREFFESKAGQRLVKDAARLRAKAGRER